MIPAKASPTLYLLRDVLSQSTEFPLSITSCQIKEWNEHIIRLWYGCDVLPALKDVVYGYIDKHMIDNE